MFSRALSQRRDDPHHRQPQTPAGALVVPVRAVQRLDRRGHHRGRGIVGFHGDIRGLLRVPAGSAVHRRDAGDHQPRQGGADRITRRPLPFRAEFESGVRRGRAGCPGDRRALPGPVHQRRARHRLARQQQHRRVDLRANARGDASHPGVDRGRRGHRRNQRDDRPLHPLPAARDPVVRGRPGELRVLSGLRRRPRRHRHAHVVAHRGHRPATG